mmetsp:Transcript_79099/g.221892  ORF Transcript_79099/g.221892 Transcript_79099/m.221892 type:complete len:203 (+) Transcript_79099:383-991(+)
MACIMGPHRAPPRVSPGGARGCHWLLQPPPLRRLRQKTPRSPSRRVCSLFALWLAPVCPAPSRSCRKASRLGWQIAGGLWMLRCRCLAPPLAPVHSAPARSTPEDHRKHRCRPSAARCAPARRAPAQQTRCLCCPIACRLWTLLRGELRWCRMCSRTDELLAGRRKLARRPRCRRPRHVSIHQVAQMVAAPCSWRQRHRFRP